MSMAEPAPFVRPGTTQEVVLDEIRRRIVAGEIEPGDAIRPDRVAAELRVSRVPVREALRILEGEGIVEHRAHHGATLATLRDADLREIYRIRQVLEAEAVTAALPSLRPAHLTSMREADAELAATAADDLATLAYANRRFHFALLEPCGMPHLLRLITLLWNATDHYRAAYYRDRAHRLEVAEDHARILAAATAGDLDELLAAIHDHRAHAVAGLRLSREDHR
jgi:DNA-binding GntR family transcriptional regulator